MNIYTRYVSGEHDTQHFNKTQSKIGQIKLRPLSGHFDAFSGPNETKSFEHWRSIMPNSAFFVGFDPVLFGHVVTMLYKNDLTNKICAVSITKFGRNIYENILLDTSSRFWPACQNLTPEHRNSNVRKALAIANLKNYNKLWNNKGSMNFNDSWDETNAGSLASDMLIMDSNPTKIGEHLLTLDFLQDSEIPSFIVDTIYDSSEADPKTTNDNNSLVMLLGKQMEQLFDPLLEYSPQAMDYSYNPPLSAAKVSQTSVIESVLEELFTVQSNYTMDLVALLQDFIIPLRVHVLADMSNSTDGATRVNAVFPPTLDEVTRINCILNNSLKSAMEYGYTEVFKVLASILPFFYKAFARHQANVSTFHVRFEKFIKHNQSYVFANKDINKRNYTPKIVQNIVLGSIFELTKLKLIIRRLYNLVIAEGLKSSNFESVDYSNSESIDVLYATIIETIDALGCEEPENSRATSKSRIFTPSGKLLTELATGWPDELQYGWMNRKVLAIYELSNTIPSSETDSGDEILIIFSDHLLFLDVTRSSEVHYKFELPDVLMNSLVNQKPLPADASFPQLKVKYWCEVNQLLAKSYEGEKGQSLSLLAYGDNRFKSRENTQDVVFANYSMYHEETAISECNSIIDHICKAQILYKSSPFHLFKLEDLNLTKFHCAHDLKTYKSERSKSPIVILLNMDMIQVREILEEFPHIFVVLSMSYINEQNVQILATSREKSLNIDEIVSTDQMNFSLREIFAQCMDIVLRSSSLTELVIRANSGKLDKIISWSNGTPISAEIMEDDKNNQAHLPPKASQFRHYPKIEPPIETDEFLPEVRDAKRNSRFFSRIVTFLKPKRTTPLKQKKTSRNASNKKVYEHEARSIHIKKPVYKKLYKPLPSLGEVSTVNSMTQNEEALPNKKEQSFKVVPTEITHEQPRVLSRNTVSSSRYSASVVAASDFQFPLLQELERITEDNSGVADSDLLERRTGNFGSVKHSPKKPKTISSEQDPVSIQNLNTHAHDMCLPHDSSEVIDNRVKVDSKLPEQSSQRDHSSKKPFKEYEFEMDKLEYPVTTTSLIDMDKSETKVPAVGVQKPVELPSLTSSSNHSEEHEPREGFKNHIGCIVSSGDLSKTVTLKSDRHLRIGQITVNALENLESRKVSPHVYSKYKMYEELPLSVFGTDEEANWTSLARDSLSNLQAEIKAMKTEVQERKISPLNELPGPQMVMVPKDQSQYTPENTFSSFDFNSHSPDHNSFETIIAAPALETESNTNTEGNDLELVDEFSKQLDAGFGLYLSGLTGSTSKFASANISDSDDMNVGQDHQERTQKKKAIVKGSSDEEHKTLQNMYVLTSDEEYFSSQEFSNALEFWKRDSAQDSESDALTTSSSEKTLMNEMIGSPSRKEHSGRWVDDGRSIDLVNNFGSIAYLSDVLTGKFDL